MPADTTVDLKLGLFRLSVGDIVLTPPAPAAPNQYTASVALQCVAPGNGGPSRLVIATATSTSSSKAMPASPTWRPSPSSFLGQPGRHTRPADAERHAAQ